MTRDPLDQAHHDLQLLTKKITTGTADRPKMVRVIDLAFAHMNDWASTTPPPRTELGTTGGSSSPREIEERAEDQRVGRNATTDHDLALSLVRTISVATERLHALVIRYTKPIDHTKLPEPTIPGCVSCARVKRKGPLTLGGHFAPVDEKNYRHEGLCRFCGDIARADAIARKLPPVEVEEGKFRKALGDLPPIEATDVYHRQGPQAAGRWLASRQPRKVS